MAALFLLFHLGLLRPHSSGFLVDSLSLPAPRVGCCGVFAAYFFSSTSVLAPPLALAIALMLATVVGIIVHAKYRGSPTRPQPRVMEMECKSF